MDDKDLKNCSAFQLVQLIKNKSVSPVEVVQYYLKRIEKYNPLLHTFLDVTFADALEAARAAEEKIMQGQIDQPLLGIPIAIADVFHLSGHPTTFGSLACQEDVAQEDGPEVKLLKEAGAIIIAKGNVSEFLFYPSAENRLSSPSLNPWNIKTSPGDSGIAAALAADLTPLGLTADLHAGARLPSSFCRTVGLKTTRGFFPTSKKHLPFSEKNFYQRSPMAKNVLDLALLLDVLKRENKELENCDYIQAAQVEKIPSLKIGWSTHLGFIPIQQDVADLFKTFLTVVEKLGFQTEEMGLELNESTLMHYRHILATDRLLPLLSPKNSKYFDQLTDYSKTWIRAGERVKGMEYSVALVHSDWVKDEVDRMLTKYDLIATPVCFVSSLPVPLTEFSIESFSKGSEADLLYWAFTIPFTLSGHPALTIPCGFNEKGQPVGVQIVGKYFSEPLLLSFAHQLEVSSPWDTEHPNLK